MPTVFTHAVVGAGLAAAAGHIESPLFVGVSTVLAALPDVDVVGFKLDIAYTSFFGHRGFSHSLCCALLVGLVAALSISGTVNVAWWLLWLYFALVMTSHGLLDGCTDGGAGIAYFSPFDTTRYFLPWRPIRVSFINPRFFRSQMFQVLWSEIRWVWLPLAVVVAISHLCTKVG